MACEDRETGWLEVRLKNQLCPLNEQPRVLDYLSIILLSSSFLSHRFLSSEYSKEYTKSRVKINIVTAADWLNEAK